MLSSNRKASLAYKIVLAALCLAGLVMNSGLITRTFTPAMFLYYTLLSNLFCFVFYIAAIIATARAISSGGGAGPVRFAPHFKGGVVLAMLLTTLIYFLIMADSPFAGSSILSITANVLVHLAVPVLVLLDWLLFDKKGRFSAGDPLVWTALPFAYYLLVLLFAEPLFFPNFHYYSGQRYPYRFLNPDLIGWASVLVNICLITAACVAAGYVLFGLDKAFAAHAKKKAQNASEAPEPSKAPSVPLAPAAPAAPLASATPAAAPQPAPLVLPAQPVQVIKPAGPAAGPPPQTAAPAPQAPPLSAPAARPAPPPVQPMPPLRPAASVQTASPPQAAPAPAAAAPPAPTQTQTSAGAGPSPAPGSKA